MKQSKLIGLNAALCSKLTDMLNDLLSNYQLLYINTRGYHWNIKGDKFFELHLKFEELYNNLVIKIDEIAERVLTLGGVPLHSFKDYLEHSEVKPAQNVSDGNTAMKNILDAFEILISKEREIFNIADDANDEGTSAMMSDYIREQEKLVWMYNSYLKS